jgi:hypothetical protein
MTAARVTTITTHPLTTTPQRTYLPYEQVWEALASGQLTMVVEAVMQPALVTWVEVVQVTTTAVLVMEMRALQPADAVVRKLENAAGFVADISADFGLYFAVAAAVIDAMDAADLNDATSVEH